MRGAGGSSKHARRVAPRWLFVALTLIAIAVPCMASATASAVTLSGTVSGQTAGNPLQPLAGVAVTVLDPQSGDIVAATTTDLDGAYEVALAAATYDVRFDPAPGQLLSSTTVGGIAVTADRVLSVVLVPAGLTRVSGVVRDAGGAPVSGASVSVSGGTSIGTTATDGSYSVLAPAGSNRRVSVNGGSAQHPGLPATWSVTSAPFNLGSGEVVRDLVLPPVFELRVRTLGDGDVPLAGVSVGVPAVDLVTDALVASNASSKLLTGAGGEVVWRVFGGDPVRNSYEVRPPEGSGYADTTYSLGRVTADATVVMRLQAMRRVSGVVRDANGAPVVGASVSVTGGPVTTTALDGAYSVLAPAASNRRVTVSSGGAQLPGLPLSWSVVSGTFDVGAEDVVRDVVLPPVFELRVRTLGEGDAPVAGVSVGVPAFDLVTSSFAASNGSSKLLTGVDGEVVWRVFGGDPVRNSYEVRPPEGSGYADATYSLGRLTADTNVVVRLQAMKRVNGVVRDANGAPVVGASVSVTGGPVTTTALDGAYSVLAPAASNRRVTVSSGGAQLPGLPVTWSVASAPFTLDSDVVRDMTLPPVFELRVRTLGDDGAPLAGVSVGLPAFDLVTSSFAASNGSSKLLTGVDGEVVWRVFGGDPVRNSYEVRPPEGSGYANTTYSLGRLTADTTVVVRFQANTDFTPPAIDCGPAPVGWVTDDVAIACTATDSQSGLADPADVQFDLVTSVADGEEDADAQTGSRQVCDSAGNCAVAGPVGGIQIDRRAPRIRFEQQPTGLGGWFVTSPGSALAIAEDANIASLDCTIDGRAVRQAPTAGPASLSLALSVRPEGRHVVECSASDAVGHLFADSGSILIDRTRPARPTAVADREPDFNGRGGWYRDEVTVTFVDHGDPDLADDSLGSGVDLATSTQPQTVATSGVHSVTGSVADIAGNRSANRSLTVRVDADPPTSELTCPDDPRRGRVARARWRDRDDDSGLAGSAAGNFVVDTSTLGQHTVFHTAVDNVGYETVSSCVYVVVP